MGTHGKGMTNVRSQGSYRGWPVASLKARMLKPVMLGLGPWAIRSALPARRHKAVSNSFSRQNYSPSCSAGASQFAWKYLVASMVAGGKAVVMSRQRDRWSGKRAALLSLSLSLSKFPQLMSCWWSEPRSRRGGRINAAAEQGSTFHPLRYLFREEERERERERERCTGHLRLLPVVGKYLP